MKDAIRLLQGKTEPRLFFGALLQSSVGTGAAYVALLLIAYDRYRSPWAISLVLLADFLPVMALGPLFGAAADRWSRRWCVVLADIVRAAAFLGIAITHSFELTIALALAAGASTALFRPAALAGLPSLFGPAERPAATALFSATNQVGWTIGPALAAAALLVTTPEVVCLANAATFAVSALLLVGVSLDAGQPRGGAEAGEPQASIWREVVDGWRVVSALVDIKIVIVASAAAMFFGGVFNVAEPLFAIETLGSGQAGYSILVAVYGLGFIAGSLAGSSGGDAARLRRSYIQGLAVTGIGSLATALSPSVGIALFAFALSGFGNGLLVVFERLLMQERITDAAFGRAFGLADTVSSWGLASAFLLAGLLSSLTGPRGLITIVAIGELVLALLVFAVLRAKAGLAPRAREHFVE